jgi:protein-tyrosine kinase
MMGLLLSARQRLTSEGTWRPLPAPVVSQLASLAETLPRTRSGLRSLALVSPARGEGTTTCTINLARALAEGGSQVLVVDANRHHPSLHEMLGLAQSPGLSEVVRGDVGCSTAVQAASLARVSVLAAGAHGGSPARAAGTLRDRVLETAAGVDFVLVDCPPVNVYEDAAAIAAQCDAVVLVLQAGRTTRQEAHAAKRLLERGNCQLLGLFLNRRKFYIPRFIYDRL